MNRWCISQAVGKSLYEYHCGSRFYNPFNTLKLCSISVSTENILSSKEIFVIRNVWKGIQNLIFIAGSISYDRSTRREIWNRLNQLNQNFTKWDHVTNCCKRPIHFVSVSCPEESNFIHLSKNELLYSSYKANCTLPVGQRFVSLDLSTLLFTFEHWKASLDRSWMLIRLNHLPEL